MRLLIIDVQNGITDERLYNFKEFIKTLKALIKTARDNNIEVIYFQHDDGIGTGFSIGDYDFEISDLVKNEPSEKVFIKTDNSCFSNKEFESYLDDVGEDSLMILGLQTNFCINSTIESAHLKGYKVYTVENGNSTFDNPYMTKEETCKYYNEFIWKDRFARILTLEEALALLKKKL